MSPLFTGAIALATEPSPNPTEGQLRPGLETWQVSPGLIGFLVTFALAVACVLLFLNMSKHLRQAGHNARREGLPVPEAKVIRFSRPGEDGAEGEGDGPDAGNGPADGPTSDDGSADGPDGGSPAGANGAGNGKGTGGSVG
ncbi:hypothetical protein GCM10010413_45070 [Promicromonospora sukumoe]|uniref:Uncharacterized protein n=1 Tax=Promicromonospora sukumoe TaxID=88382 RepID=A0A7W3PFF2_9MICO|nr:hypothetical protein [Promicromonospora sukumoe]MBA8810075.1 hypothetical protein [Promicromonospora sukumoe]